MKRSVAAQRFSRFGVGLVVLSLLMASLAVPAMAQPEGAERVHPQLAKIADQRPNEMVRIIVQGNNPNGKLGATLDRLGGTDKRALPLVKGYTAQIPAGKARLLAREPGVEWVTIDAKMASTNLTASADSAPTPPKGKKATVVDAAGTASAGVSASTEPSITGQNPVTTYPSSVGAPELWNSARPVTGSGVTVAVIDSGIDSSLADFSGSSGTRVLTSVKYGGNSNASNDQYGHGTHVAGIIAGNGKGSDGKYIGIAPNANLISIKVSDSKGDAYVSDVVDALQWLVLNRSTHNIKVVNLALLSTVAESYLTSPLDAAVEMAWLSGITVVVSAGNLGPDSMLYPPANDPLVITVGAVDTSETAAIGDDVLPEWSSYGSTQDSFAKPEIVAPGRKIISNLSGPGSTLGREYRDRVVDKDYLRLSGTSMAAAVASGVVALGLDAHPAWTPDQVKSALMSSARPVGSASAGSGEVNAVALVANNNPGFANGGVPLNAGVAGVTGVGSFDSATWNSATWNSATWNSATWNSATWNSATWNSATWNSATWNSATWNSATWNSTRLPD